MIRVHGIGKVKALSLLRSQLPEATSGRGGEDQGKRFAPADVIELTRRVTKSSGVNLSQRLAAALRGVLPASQNSCLENELRRTVDEATNHMTNPCWSNSCDLE